MVNVFREPRRVPGDIVTSLIDCVEREEAEEVGNRVVCCSSSGASIVGL